MRSMLQLSFFLPRTPPPAAMQVPLPCTHPCHTYPLPCMPPTTHTPPTMHAPHHACPPTMHAPRIEFLTHACEILPCRNFVVAVISSNKKHSSRMCTTHLSTVSASVGIHQIPHQWRPCTVRSSSEHVWTRLQSWPQDVTSRVAGPCTVRSMHPA